MAKITFNATTSTKLLGNSNINIIDNWLTAAAPTLNVQCVDQGGVKYSFAAAANNDDGIVTLYYNDNANSIGGNVVLGPGGGAVFDMEFGITVPYSYDVEAYVVAPGKNPSTVVKRTGSLYICDIV